MRVSVGLESAVGRPPEVAVVLGRGGVAVGGDVIVRSQPEMRLVIRSAVCSHRTLRISNLFRM